MKVGLTEHPSLQELLERAEDPGIASHLEACGACRARVLMLQLDGEPSTLPQLDAARRALSDARRAASLSAEGSWGSDPLARAKPLAFLPVGRVIDRYEVQERIGVGAMGAVYRVEHTTLGSSHALKVVHRASDGARERLIREGQAQGRLQHAHVVPVTDVIDVDGAPGLVMAFVDGPSLSAWIAANGPPSLPLVHRLGAHILRAVAAAHDAGVIHRDLKPGNVLIATTDEGPAARVCDFGLARSPDDADRARGPIGTPGYMAPEQIVDASRADARSDLFAAGALLYELATGRRAFDGPDIVEVWRRIETGTYPPLQEQRADLPAAMAAVITRALEVDPADRFADATSMLTAWQGAARPAPTAPSRRWGSAAATGVLAASALLGGVAAWRLQSRAVEASTPHGTEAPRTDAADRRLTGVTEAYQIFAIDLSDDDEELLYADSRGLWRQRVDEGTPRRVLSGGPIQSVDWVGPDEAILSIAGELEGTWRLDLTNGERTLLSPRKGYGRPSPDGRTLLLSTKDGLFLVDPSTGEERLLRPLAEGEYGTTVAWSPDGAYVASVFVQGAQKPPWVERVAVATGERTVLHEHRGLVVLGLSALDWVAPDRIVFARADSRTAGSLHAIDGASTVDRVGDPTLLRSWSGYHLIRMRTGGEAMVASRGTVRQDVMRLEADKPLAMLTPDAWSERPLGWTRDGVLMTSDRGEDGLFRLDEDGTVERVASLEGFPAAVLDAPGGHRLWARFRGIDDTDGHRFEIVRQEADGSTRPLASHEVGTPVNMAIATDALQCSDAHCLVSRSDEGTLTFRWLHPADGAMEDASVSLDHGQRHLVWTLSPEAAPGVGTVTVLLGAPSERVDLDLATGAQTRWTTDFDLPLGAAWGPEGALYASAASFRSLEPYRIVRFGEGGETTVVHASENLHHSSLFPSPDRTALAVSVTAFGTDVWWLGTDGAGAADSP